MNETIFAMISNQGVDFITRFHLSKRLGIFYNRRLAASNCALLAGIGEVVVAWNIVPLAVFMPNDDHTVFSGRKETIWLVGSPVLILQCAAIGPAEVMLKHLVIEANPLIIMAHTIHKHLLFLGQDAGEVSSLQATLPLGRVPGAPVGEVFVALALEFVPAIVTGLRILLTKCTNVAWEAETPKCIKSINTGCSIPTRVRVAFIEIKFTLVSTVARHTGAHVGRFCGITSASIQARIGFTPVRSW